jgi:hypothetical protein
VGDNGSEWFIVEYPTSIYINNNINMKHDQTKSKNQTQSTMNKITSNIISIKDMFKPNLLLIDTNKIKSRANKNITDLNINTSESNKRNKYGFPIFSK